VSAVDKLLELTGNGPETPDPDTELLRAAQRSARELEALVSLAGDDDDDDDEGGGDHSGHAAYKAMIARKVDPKKAAQMCARSDKKVKASQLARSLVLMLSGTPGQDIVLTLSAGRPPAELPPVGEREAAAALLAELSVLTAEDRKKPSAHTIGDSDDYPIPDVAHLTSAVARYKQGKLAGHSKAEVAAHIRHHARRLGREVDLSTGCGLEEAAEALALARKEMGGGGIIMNHGPFRGTHAHGHFMSQVHEHPHQHFDDNRHDGGPQHRPGSKPGGQAGW
jgi:hypothetical protein